MMRNFLIAVGILSILLSGCGYKEGVSTGRQMSFLYFSGNTENISVSVDGGEQFTVKPGRDNQYEVLPGKHIIVVYKQGVILVEREVYIGDGISKEIGVN
jgi:hypothetical protein